MGHLPFWATGDEKLHLPHSGYMAISKAILKTRVFLPLHSFIDQVLEFFNIVLLLPNCGFLHCLLGAMRDCAIGWAFCLYFRAQGSGEAPQVLNLTGQGDATGIIGLPNNVGQWKNDFFFYPSNRFGKFRVGCK